MLCQLSYRGSAGAIVARGQSSSRISARIRCSACWSCSTRPFGGGGELPLELPLAQPEQQLLRGRDGDGVLLGERVELREQRRQLAVGRRLARAGARARGGAARCRSARGRARRGSRISSGWAATPASALRSSRCPASSSRGETTPAALELPRAGASPACVSGGRSSRSAARRSASWRSGESGSVARNVRIAANALCRSRARSCSSRTRWHGIARPARRGAARTPPGRPPGRFPSAARRPARRTPAATASSIPRSVASCPAASASKQRKSRFVSRASSRSCRSVSAVPIEATTGWKPACRSASTSVFPSTTTARSSFAIACRPGVEPVEEVALLEEVALRRVDVLRLQAVVVVQLARLEAADARRARRRAERGAGAGSSRCRAGCSRPAREQLLALVALLQRAPRERRAARARSRAGTSRHTSSPSPREARYSRANAPCSLSHRTRS